VLRDRFDYVDVVDQTLELVELHEQPLFVLVEEGAELVVGEDQLGRGRELERLIGVYLRHARSFSVTLNNHIAYCNKIYVYMKNNNKFKSFEFPHSA